MTSTPKHLLKATLHFSESDPGEKLCATPIIAPSINLMAILNQESSETKQNENRSLLEEIIVSDLETLFQCIVKAFKGSDHNPVEELKGENIEIDYFLKTNEEIIPAVNTTCLLDFANRKMNSGKKEEIKIRYLCEIFGEATTMSQIEILGVLNDCLQTPAQNNLTKYN